MSIESVKKYFGKFGISDKIQEFNVSTATVELAAKALNTSPERIAKTLSFKLDDICILIVTAGDAKVNNAKFKEEFKKRARMLTQDEVLEKVGHAVGGVCPFAVNKGLKIYLDISLKRFNTVFPACGNSRSAIELTCEELFKYSNAEKWINVCTNWS